jgi:hypothetical protein
MNTTPVKSVFTTVFLTLSAVLLLFVVAVVYFIVVDPLHLKPLLFGTSGTPQGLSEMHATTDTPADQSNSVASSTDEVSIEGFTLSEAQKSALSGIGIDPASIPSTISPTRVACFEEILGTERVSEIRAGAVPSALELLKVKSCIN